MEIIYARRMGFCHGVKRAFEGALEVASEIVPSDSRARSADSDAGNALTASESLQPRGYDSPEKPIYILGEIVHNNAVVSRIESYGIRHIQTPDEIKEKRAKVIIRAHGGTRQQVEELQRLGHEIVDLTCIVVKKVREKALNLERRHPAVIILGKKNHPEVIGLCSWLSNPYVVTDVNDIEAIPEYDSVGVLSQTTFSRDKIEILVGAIREKFPRVEVLDTVCPHTDRNQEASVEIATASDLVLVVGDEHSSNSKRLFEVVKKVNPNTYFVSGADDVKADWFPEKGSAKAKRFKVGITAGASTPDWVVEEIARRVESFG